MECKHTPQEIASEAHITCSEQGIRCNHLVAGHDRPCNNCLKAEVEQLKTELENEQTRSKVEEVRAVHLKTELEQHKKFIADAADNHIELCRQLGTHRPIHEAGCFGVSECLNCFRVGFAVMEHAKRRNKEVIDELAEVNKLVTQYRVRLVAVGAELEKEKESTELSAGQYRKQVTDLSDDLEKEKEGHKKTAKQFVDLHSVNGCLDIKIKKLEEDVKVVAKQYADATNTIWLQEINVKNLIATLDPVLEWYNGDGRITDPVLMLSEAIADLQKDRKELMTLTAEHKKLWDSCVLPDECEMESKLRAADALVKVIDERIEHGHLSSRSDIADARLDYGDPYKYKAKESTELSAAHVKITALEEDWKNAVEFIEYVRDSFHISVAPELREAARKVIEGEDW